MWMLPLYCWKLILCLVVNQVEVKNERFWASFSVNKCTLQWKPSIYTYNSEAWFQCHFCFYIALLNLRHACSYIWTVPSNAHLHIIYPVQNISSIDFICKFDIAYIGILGWWKVWGGDGWFLYRDSGPECAYSVHSGSDSFNICRRGWFYFSAGANSWE